MLLQTTIVITSLAFEKCKKECDIVKIILVKGFCPLKTKITHFPDGFLLNTWQQVQTTYACCADIDITDNDDHLFNNNNKKNNNI